ncbi:MAG: hypothetical protein HZA95_01335 [Candidatus Vogelbacteria bacterium]|nr:hypothetical protein [Candidatus Vogelbacteria bacterium]
MADAGADTSGRIFSIILIIVAIGFMVYLVKMVGREPGTTGGTIKSISSSNDESTLNNDGSEGVSNSDGDSTQTPNSTWVAYSDSAWNYSLRFPKEYRAKMIGDNELISPIAGEVILSGIVVAPKSSINTNSLPDFDSKALTLLLTDWSSFSSSKDFLEQVYISGTIPKNQLEKISLSGRLALRYKVSSTVSGKVTTHTEIIIAGPGTKVLKIIYWPASDTTLSAIASTVGIK